MQFKVSEGDEILVNYLGKEKPEAEVLLFVDDKKVQIGRPNLKKVKVNLKTIKEEVKGKKVTVQKFKAKSRYRKKIGFRPTFTRLQVAKISLSK